MSLVQLVFDFAKEYESVEQEMEEVDEEPEFECDCCCPVNLYIGD